MITKTGRNLVLNQNRIYTLADKISEQPISFFGSDIVNSKRGNTRQIHPGRCYDFLGTNEYVEVPDHDDFSFGDGSTDSPFSITMWVYMDSSSDTRLLTKGSYNFGDGNSEYALYANLEVLRFALFDYSETAYISRQYSGSLSNYQGKWVHVSATYDGLGLIGGIKIYIDSIRVDDQNSSSLSYTAMEPGTKPVTIGYDGSYSIYFNGKMHDVRIHSKELSKAEIWEVMRGFASGYEVGWWKMEEGEGDISFDSSGRSHHGTVENATLSTFHVNSSTLPKSFLNDNGYSSSRYYSGSEDIYSPADSCADLNPGTGDYTVDGWFFNTNDTVNRGIVSKGDNSPTDVGYYIWLNASNLLTIRHSNGTAYEVDSAAAVPYGWNYFAMVVDRDYAMQQYLNLLDVRILSIDEQVDIQSTVVFSIGSYADTVYYNDSFIGTIRYTARALTLDEVRDTYNNGFTEDDDTKMIARFDSYGNYIDIVGERPFYYETTTPVYIPRNEFNSSKDVSGEQLKYSGEVKYNAVVSSMCADFDGADDYISVSDDDLLSFGDSVTDSPFSLSAWINFSDVSLSTIIQKSGEWDFIITSADLLGITLYDSATDMTRSTPALTVYENEWTHIAATYDGSGDISGLKVYVNAERFDNQTFTTGSYVVMDNNSNNLTISSASNTNDGSMCDVRVFDKELTKAEITIVMGGDRNGSEVAWYSFAEGNGKDVYDVSGNNLHGTVINATLSSFWGQTQTKFHYNNRRGFSDGLYFNGTTAYGSRTASADFQPGTDSFSIEAIICLSDYSDGTSQTIYSNLVSSTDRIWFYINSTGILTLNAVDTSTVIDADTDANPFTDGQVHCVGVAVDPGNSVIFYVDGEVIASTTTTNTGLSLTPDSTLYVGAYNTSTQLLDGVIYAIRYSNKTRTADEMFYVYKYGFGSDEYTVALWDFRDGLGINITDENANNLTLTNTAQVRMPALSTNLRKDILGHPIQHLGGGLNGSGDIIDFTGGVAAPRWNDFRLGYVDLNGTDDYIDCGDHDDLSFGDGSDDSPFSLSAWINMIDASYFVIVSKTETGTGLEWSFYVDSVDDLTLTLYGVNPANSVFKSILDITNYEDEWIHVAATYDGRGGIAAYDGINLYINGQIETDPTAGDNGTYVAMSDTDAALFIGSESAYYADGYIRDVKIYGVELTATQVSEDYKIGSTSAVIIRNFKLYKDAYDSSVNRKHGEIKGTNINFPKATVDTTYEQGDYLAYPFYKKEFNNPYIECITSGNLSSSFNNVYGIWEFDWYKTATDITVYIISNFVDVNSADGYAFQVTSSENVQLVKVDAGSGTNLFTFGTASINEDQWYNIKIVRNSILNEYVNGAVGTFGLYLDDVLMTADTGSNPITDNTHTSGRYIVIALTGAGNIVRNFKFNDELVNISKLQVDNGSHKVQGDKENSFVLLERPLIQQALSRPVFRYTKTGEL